MEKLEHLLTDYYGHQPKDREIVIHTGPVGMELLRQAFLNKAKAMENLNQTSAVWVSGMAIPPSYLIDGEEGIKNFCCVTQITTKKFERNIKENLENPDFGRIFALETKF